MYIYTCTGVDTELEFKLGREGLGSCGATDVSTW